MHEQPRTFEEMPERNAVIFRTDRTTVVHRTQFIPYRLHILVHLVLSIHRKGRVQKTSGRCQSCTSGKFPTQPQCTKFGHDVTEFPNIARISGDSMRGSGKDYSQMVHATETPQSSGVVRLEARMQTRLIGLVVLAFAAHAQAGPMRNPFLGLPPSLFPIAEDADVRPIASFKVRQVQSAGSRPVVRADLLSLHEEKRETWGSGIRCTYKGLVRFTQTAPADVAVLNVVFRENENSNGVGGGPFALGPMAKGESRLRECWFTFVGELSPRTIGRAVHLYVDKVER